nr:ribonuclease H-like domain-containing protein [Tanacetum cinerariifolium]
MEGEDTNQSSPPPIAPPEALRWCHLRRYKSIITTTNSTTRSPKMVSSVKLPILKKGEYILWTMKMEQYLAHIDYALWEVILNGNGEVHMTKDEAGNEVEVPLVTAQQILPRTRERKAKSTLIIAILDKHITRFHEIKDAKTLYAAIKTRFGGNAESKKMQKNVLKQQFEIFSVSNSEGLDKGYDRFQRLLSLLEIHGAESTSSTNEFNASYSVSTATCHSSQAQEESTFPGIAKQSGIQETWVEMLGIQEEEATNFALMAFTSNPLSSSSSNSEEEVTETMFDNRSSDEENSQANDRFKKGEGFHAVSPPLTGNYMPPKPDLSFDGLDDSIYKFKISETVTSLSKELKDAPETSIAFVEKPKEVRTSAYLIEE